MEIVPLLPKKAPATDNSLKTATKHLFCFQVSQKFNKYLKGDSAYKQKNVYNKQYSFSQIDWRGPLYPYYMEFP